MKKFLGVFFIALLISGQFCFASGNKERIEGNNQTIVKEINIGAFDKVSTSISGLVNLHISPTHRVVLSCDDNLVQYVDITVNNRVLKIDVKNNERYRFRNLVVDVYAPNINSVNLTGIGTTKGAIDCEDFTSTLTGTGTIELTGNIRTSKITLVGTGRFLGRDLETVEVSAHMNGTGLIEIWAVDRLDANNTGTGNIRYRGRPQISLSGSGTGRIEPINE